MDAISTLPTISFFQSLIRRDLFQQMWKFMSVGCINLGLSAVIFGVSYAHLRTALPNVQALLASNSIAFLITVTNAFFLNSRFTFQKNNAGVREYVRYGLVNIAGFTINSGLLLLFARTIALIRHETLQQMDASFHLGHWIAFFCAAGCSFFWNFLVSRHWVFQAHLTERR